MTTNDSHAKRPDPSHDPSHAEGIEGLYGADVKRRGRRGKQNVWSRIAASGSEMLLGELASSEPRIDDDR